MSFQLEGSAKDLKGITNLGNTIIVRGSAPAKNSSSGLAARGGGGMCLGIWLVLTGWSLIGIRMATNPPTKVSGIDTMNHTSTMPKYIPIGTAPLVPVKHDDDDHGGVEHEGHAISIQ